MGSCSGVEITTLMTIDDRTTIDYHLCQGSEVEFYVGGPERFVLVTSERGLHNLVARFQAALGEVQSAAAGTDEDCPTA